MHFGHPKTITAFKNQNFLKIWVFQGFPYTRLGSDLAILSQFWGKKFQNLCKKCPSHGEKNLKIFLFFKNILNSPRMHFGHPRTITTFKKWNSVKIWVFQRFPYTRFGHFGLIFSLKISKSLQKMPKKVEKFQKKFGFWKTCSKVPPNVFWRS